MLLVYICSKHCEVIKILCPKHSEYIKEKTNLLQNLLWLQCNTGVLEQYRYLKSRREMNVSARFVIIVKDDVVVRSLLPPPITDSVAALSSSCQLASCL